MSEIKSGVCFCGSDIVLFYPKHGYINDLTHHQSYFRFPYHICKHLKLYSEFWWCYCKADSIAKYYCHIILLYLWFIDSATSITSRLQNIVIDVRKKQLPYLLINSLEVLNNTHVPRNSLSTQAAALWPRVSNYPRTKNVDGDLSINNFVSGLSFGYWQPKFVTKLQKNMH